MDIEKTRTEVEQHKEQLVERLKQIALEIHKLTDEAEEAKRQLIGIEQVLDGFSFMENENISVVAPIGLTDNVRKILSETKIPLVPTQIRDALLARGITGSSSKVLLINVHKTLERIEDELETSTTSEGKTAYKRRSQWNDYIGVASGGKDFPNLLTLNLLAGEPVKAEHHPVIPRRRRFPRRALNQQSASEKK